MTLIATKSLAYGGQRLAPGDSFEPRSARDARTLKAIGKAKDAPEAEVDEPPVAEPKTSKNYKRRDLKAED